jgi:hypothetical protein
MDLPRLRDEAGRTSTENLLDRVTVYRAEMESPAVAIIESELRARGVSSAEVEAHAAMREKDGLLRRPDGSLVRCNYCPRPATAHRWGWYRLWGWFLPLLPRYFHLCKEHEGRLPTDAHGRTLHYDVAQAERRDHPCV